MSGSEGFISVVMQITFFIKTMLLFELFIFALEGYFSKNRPSPSSPAADHRYPLATPYLKRLTLPTYSIQPISAAIRAARWSLFGHVLRLPLDAPVQLAIDAYLEDIGTPNFRGCHRRMLKTTLGEDLRRI